MFTLRICVEIQMYEGVDRCMLVRYTACNGVSLVYVISTSYVSRDIIASADNFTILL